MRRSFLIPVAVAALGASVLTAAPVQGQSRTPWGVGRSQTVQTVVDERRGMVFDGLQHRSGGPCGIAFELVTDAAGGRTRCTHGPDPAPDGVDVRVHRDFGAESAEATPQPGTAADQSGIPCYGTGSDGYRVQLLYVRVSGSADNSANYFPTFAYAAANANYEFRDSAVKTGGVRNIRYVTDASCNLVIQKVQVPFYAINTLSGMANSLSAQGFNRPDRKYLAWVDNNTYCGISEIYTDDRANTTPGLSSSNYSNGNPVVKGTFARVDNGCWNQSNSVEAHELTHMLGGVQPNAPHGTKGFHCRDESDRMCYADAAGVLMTQVCSAPNERLFDCNGDDYFNTNPTEGSWLANHWNVANNAFLANADPGAPPPPPPPTTPPTSPPPTNPPPTNPPPTNPPPTTAPPGPTTTAPKPGTTPSAPRNLTSYKLGSGVLLVWSAPTTGTVTGYNVYRKTATGSFAKIADLGTTSTYTDSSGSAGVVYTYALTAENASGEGPLSNQVSTSK